MSAKKKRSEAFFGLHFDFHAGIGQKNIGENCSPETIARLLDEVKPDYVQCDTKGHAGATSYPTKVGYPAPDMKGDILRMWRSATQERGVALYAHHSGVWDNNAILHNPDWAACGPDGKPSAEKNSVFGPYADRLLIPQLKEMALDYGLDGAWIDGECWAVIPDYSRWAVDKYRNIYMREPPQPEDADFEDYLKFCRAGFIDYIEHYLREVHAAAPGFEITSNWMYSSFMPEKPSLPIDFISGDYSPNDSLNTARFEGRCMAGQGLPWDLMAWGFSTGDKLRCVKEYEQLCQEAASVIMLGGGFQVYNKQLVGTVQDWAIPMWAKLASFCREREALCHKAEFIPQVGVVFSQKAHYRRQNGLFANWGKYISELRGTLCAILDGGLSAEVLPGWQVLEKAGEGKLGLYGALVVTDLETIEPELKTALLDYAEKGGRLIISGYNSAQLFMPYLNIDITGGSESPSAVYITSDGRMAPVVSPWREIAPAGADTKILNSLYLTDDTEGKAFAAATEAPYGDGKIYGVYFNIGAYQATKTAAVRDYVRELLCGCFTPAAETGERGLIEVALMKKDGAARINLLNLGGQHSDQSYKNFDRVPPLYDVDVTIRCAGEPESVTLEPEGEPLEYIYTDGMIKLTLNELHIHSVIEIKGAEVI